jgi:hypothetical protein
VIDQRKRQFGVLGVPVVMKNGTWRIFPWQRCKPAVIFHNYNNYTVEHGEVTLYLLLKLSCTTSVCSLDHSHLSHLKDG